MRPADRPVLLRYRDDLRLADPAAPAAAGIACRRTDPAPIVTLAEGRARAPAAIAGRAAAGAA